MRRTALKLTRCLVDRYLPLVQRSSMSPRFTMMVPGGDIMSNHASSYLRRQRVGGSWVLPERHSIELTAMYPHVDANDGTALPSWPHVVASQINPQCAVPNRPVEGTDSLQTLQTATTPSMLDLRRPAGCETETGDYTGLAAGERTGSGARVSRLSLAM